MIPEVLSKTSIIPILAILVSTVAVFPIYLSRDNANLREFWTFLAAFIKLGLVASMVPWILSGHTYQYTLFKILDRISISFIVDGFGLSFALVASILWVITTVYSIGYMRAEKEPNQTRYFICFSLALSATIGVAFSANLFTLYLFYELLSLSTFPLVTHNGDEAAQKGGKKYLSYLLGGSILFVLPAMITCYAIAHTLDFVPGGIFFGQNLGVFTPILLLMFIFGFAKAGLMPLHSWLPNAMVAPTPVSALLHAVAVVKVGVFSIARVITGIFGAQMIIQSDMVTVICYIAGFTVIGASLIALSQDNLKRMLAFSTVGQLAYIIMGLGLCTQMAWVGAGLHVVMHAFGKITLFFCAGAIFVATGRKYISQLDGIGRKMPITMGAFFIGALSVIGFPFTGGLISKLYMVIGSAQADQIGILVIYLVSSFLNICYFFPVVFRAFFAKGDKETASFKEAPLYCLLPPVITAAASILLFFYPNFFIELVALGLG